MHNFVVFFSLFILCWVLNYNYNDIGKKKQGFVLNIDNLKLVEYEQKKHKNYKDTKNIYTQCRKLSF